MKIVCQCRGCKISRSGVGYQPCSNREPKPEYVAPPSLVKLGSPTEKKTSFLGKWFR